jgi:proton-dependent oligopeptide transporter, POT family
MRNEGQPKGVYWCSAVELGERFSFYAMRAIFVLFMVAATGMGFAPEKAGAIYGWYLGTVYLTPLIGGYIADRYWGKDKAIAFGGLFMMIGQFLLTLTAWIAYKSGPESAMTIFYIALVVLVFGSGFIKANITSVIGDLYEDKNDSRKDSAFTIFYMCINLGALVAPIIAGYLGEKIGWHWGFLSAAIGMGLTMILYYGVTRKHLAKCSFTAANCKKINEDGSIHKDEPLTKEEKQRIAVIFIMAFFVMFFWFAFEQAGSSMTLFAKHSIDRTILGWKVPASMFQVINPLMIVVLAPMFADMWKRLSRNKKEPSTPMKFVLGLVFLAVGFVILAVGSKGQGANGALVSIWWLIFAYLLHTIGELCLSPVGLSLVTKLAPAKFASLLMGTWFLANFVANLASGYFAGGYSIENTESHFAFFMTPVYLAGAAAIVLLLLSKPIRKWMHGIH